MNFPIRSMTLHLPGGTAALTTLRASAAGLTFDRCVGYRRHGRTHVYFCRKGLWSVSCSDKKDAEREAQRYWHSYLLDGEYGGFADAAATQS